MVALLLSVVDRKVVESVVVDLANVLHSFVYLVLSTFEMCVDEGKGSIFEAEPDCNGTFVTRHTREASFDFDLSEAL